MCLAGSGIPRVCTWGIEQYPNGINSDVLKKCTFIKVDALEKKLKNEDLRLSNNI